MRWNKLLIGGLVLSVVVNIFQAGRGRESVALRAADLEARRVEAAKTATRMADLETLIRSQRNHLAAWGLAWSDEPPKRDGWYYLGGVGTAHSKLVPSDWPRDRPGPDDSKSK